MLCFTSLFYQLCILVYVNENWLKQTLKETLICATQETNARNRSFRIEVVLRVNVKLPERVTEGCIERGTSKGAG